MKSEIEEAIKNKDDFVKINYLMRFLRNADNIETRKFILLKLAGINESRGMFREAARNVCSAADLSVTFREKIEFYMKEAEFYIKLGEFIFADKAFQKAYSYGNAQEKMEMKAQYREIYRMQAKIAEQQNKQRKAVEIYEKLYSIPQEESKRIEVKEKLIEIYEKLGRLAEARRLKNSTSQKIA